ncbi:hypothetical protein LCM20_15565 [Halobacillus litoralis]|nr:hypothetical protein [Halobacillus litoralis]MCA0972024.1 hypothetical protein [Halobacillus litoralis]
MEAKPLFYDGTLHDDAKEKDLEQQEPLTVTDEMRTFLSGNPFSTI